MFRLARLTASSIDVIFTVDELRLSGNLLKGKNSLVESQVGVVALADELFDGTVMILWQCDGAAAEVGLEPPYSKALAQQLGNALGGQYLGIKERERKQLPGGEGVKC